MAPTSTITRPTRAPAEASRDELVREHLELVRRLATRYARRHEPLEDLVQAGCIGLLKAADGFDPDRGIPFAAYATTHITGELRRYFRDHGWSVHTPRRLQELHLRLGPVGEELTQRLGRQPTVADLAQATGEPPEAVRQALAAGNAYRATPLDAAVERQETGRTAAQVDVDRLLDRSVLRAGLRSLPERQQLLLRLRYVDDLSQAEIAARLGVSQVHVSRLLRRSLDSLRTSLAA